METAKIVDIFDATPSTLESDNVRTVIESILGLDICPYEGEMPEGMVSGRLYILRGVLMCMEFINAEGTHFVSFAKKFAYVIDKLNFVENAIIVENFGIEYMTEALGH